MATGDSNSAFPPPAAGEYDLFISYNSHDGIWVDELANRLRAEGLRPWLDQWELVAGDQLQGQLGKALDAVPCVVVVLGQHGPGPWQQAEVAEAIRRRIYTPGGSFRVVPVLMPGVRRGDRNSLSAFLRDTKWAEFHNDLPYEKGLLELVKGIRGWRGRPTDEPVSGDCPYRGLEFFDIQHARFFHGRGALTQWLLDKLRKQPGAEEPNRLLAILGAAFADDE